MPTIEESWSGRQYQRGENATRVFTAQFATTEVVTEDAARVALANTYGVQRTSWYPQDIRLVAQEPSVKRDGPYFMTVTVNYVKIELQQQEEDPNPLDALPIISWEIAAYQEPVDSDIHGNPLTNSAGDVFDGLVNDFYSTVLTVTRNESTFDINMALAYTGATNSDSFQVPGPNGGSYTVPPLWALCRGMLPATEYQADVPYVPVRRIIEIRTPITDIERSGEVSLFDWRILDQGMNGRFTTTVASVQRTNQIGHIVNATGSPIERPVRFNGDGIPIDNGTAQYRIGQLERARFVDQSPPIGAMVNRYPKACFLWYQRVRRVAFSGMGL